MKRRVPSNPAFFFHGLSPISAFDIVLHNGAINGLPRRLRYPQKPQAFDAPDIRLGHQRVPLGTACALASEVRVSAKKVDNRRQNGSLASTQEIEAVQHHWGPTFRTLPLELI